MLWTHAIVLLPVALLPVRLVDLARHCSAASTAHFRQPLIWCPLVFCHQLMMCLGASRGLLLLSPAGASCLVRRTRHLEQQERCASNLARLILNTLIGYHELATPPRLDLGTVRANCSRGRSIHGTHYISVSVRKIHIYSMQAPPHQLNYTCRKRTAASHAFHTSTMLWCVLQYSPLHHRSSPPTT
jgi:hypothetical protein